MHRIAWRGHRPVLLSLPFMIVSILLPCGRSLPVAGEGLPSPGSAVSHLPLDPGHSGQVAPAPLAASRARDTWTWTGGPQGAVVMSLIATPRGTLLAGTDNGGLYRSTDGGDSWLEADPSLAWPCCNYSLFGLAASDLAVYAGTWGGGVYRSDDDGLTWYPTGSIPDESYPIVNALAACRFGETVYAGGNFGIARSDDGGGSWTADENGLPSGWVRGLALHGGLPYAFFDSGVYRRDPATGAWSPFAEGLWADYGQQSFCAAAGTLFLATHEGGVFHLDCADAAWTELNAGFEDDNVDAVVAADQTLYAGLMGSAVRRWDPAAQAWVWNGVDLWNRDVRAMASLGRTPYAGTYGGGVFRLDLATQGWILSREGMASPFVRDIASDGERLYAALFGGGIQISADEGLTWSLAPGAGPPNVFPLELAVDGGAVYAGTWSGIWKSTDQGQSWTGAGLPAEAIFALEVLPGGLYAGTFGGQVWVSSDGGSSWSERGTGIPFVCVQDLALVGGTLYAATLGQGVFQLPAGETVWAQMNAGLPETRTWSMGVHAGQLYVGLQSNGIWRWDAGTASWVATPIDNTMVFFLKSLAGRLWMGGWGQLLSSADGESWTDEHEGLKSWLSVNALDGDADWLYAGLDGGGIWRRSLATGLEGIDPGTGGTGARLSVTPNPFLRGAQLRFTLARPAPVALAVYDVAGRLVARLVEGELPAGVQERQWDGRTAGGEAAPAGLYLIRLEVAGRVEVTKSVRLR